jgi:hypothetical protein
VELLLIRSDDFLEGWRFGIGCIFTQRCPPPPWATGNFSTITREPWAKLVAAAAHPCKRNVSPEFNIKDVFMLSPQVVPDPLAGIVGPLTFGTVEEGVKTKYLILNVPPADIFIVKFTIALLELSLAV